jgi:hypothetical protein
MLPSDHYVRMYNELFKMLADQSQEDLKKYWMWISRRNDLNQGLGSYIKENGFQGMFEYWDHIKFEENCDMDMNITDEYFEFKMHKCPSLSKNLDNDAGLCMQYCEHCAGWIHPVIRKYGFFPVYDIISPTEPRCHFRAYRDRELAAAFSKQARKPWDPYDDLLSV